MKYLLELILTTAIMFFVWNFLQRLFLPKPPQGRPHSRPAPQQDKNQKHGLNWDAEDAEFEEIKDEEKLKK